MGEKEEQVLFPILRAGGHPMARQPISMMRHEHEDHGRTLDKLDELTQGITPPPGACNTWRALYTGLAQLKSDLMEHIHLENNLLFPTFEAAPASSCGTAGGCGCACLGLGGDAPGAAAGPAPAGQRHGAGHRRDGSQPHRFARCRCAGSG